MKPFGPRSTKAKEKVKKSAARKAKVKSSTGSKRVKRSSKSKKNARAQQQQSKQLTDEEKIFADVLVEWKPASELAYDSISSHCKTMTNEKTEDFMNKALIKETIKMDEASKKFGLHVE